DGTDYIYDAAKKYVLTGTFRTNGLELQVLAFDTRVVKGFQPDATLAPGRTDPRMGNTRYLTEIRNVYKSLKMSNRPLGHFLMSYR
ncbi:hypothetical protein BGZ75_002707, partial [Mortierella antarctica]